MLLLPAAVGADDRGTVLLRYGCKSEVARREITLFANGTVRLREGLWTAQELYLDELTSAALADNLRLLREVKSDPDPTAGVQLPMQGEWIDKCEIELNLPDREAQVFRFSGFDIAPLAAAQIIQIAEDLAENTRPLAQVDRLPFDYKPQNGDILRTAEGERFKVLRLTADGLGVELEGLDQPLRLYVKLAELAEAFSAKEAAPER